MMTMTYNKNETFEELYKKLQAISELLKTDDISLDEAIKKYDEGNELIKKMQEILDEARAKIERASEDK